MKTGSRDVVGKSGVRNKGARKKRVPLFKQAILKAGYDLIEKTMIQTNFNKSKAAEILGIDRHTLNSKIKEYRKIA